MKWQPIETAPTDRNVILTDGETVAEGTFFNGHWRWDRNENIAFATYWMPLPALPSNGPHEGPSGASREGPLDAVVGPLEGGK